MGFGGVNFNLRLRLCKKKKNGQKNYIIVGFIYLIESIFNVPLHAALLRFDKGG